MNLHRESSRLTSYQRDETHIGIRALVVLADVFGDGQTNETRAEEDEEGDGHDQVPGVKQKWKLLPHFLKLRGLMRQHIDSYDYFVNVDISKVNQGSGIQKNIHMLAFVLA